MWKRLRGVLVGCALAGALGAGCSFSPGIPDDAQISCRFQSDCPEGWTCDEGRSDLCVLGCTVTGGPTSLEATIGDGAVRLVWGAPQTNALGFDIEVEVDGTVLPDLVQVVGDARTATHDPGVGNATYRYRIRGTRDTCTGDWSDYVSVASSCGDGLIGPTESCDPGTADSASCDLDGGTGAEACTLRECGDGYVNVVAGEACDDGTQDSAMCNFAAGSTFYACTLATCGDGYTNVEAGEECDTGPQDTSLCNYAGGTGAAACRVPTCGDGYVNTASGEDCEEGTGDTATCDYAAGMGINACTAAICGDGYVSTAAGEACDEGPVDSSSCNYALGLASVGCQVPVCGDGYLNAAAGESCDDGNTISGDNCPPLCAVVETTLPLTWAGDSGEDSAVALAGDGALWLAVWSSSEPADGVGEDNDILLSRSLNGGISWTYPVSLVPEALADEVEDAAPSIATDGSGTWVVIWESGRAGSGTDSDIVYVRSTDNGDTWSTLQVLNDYGSTDDVDDRTPKLATDGAGNWLAVWSSAIDISGAGSDIDIIASLSDDGGETWGSAFLLNDSGSTDALPDFNPSVSFGDSTWIVTWESSNDFGGLGSDSDILFSRSTNGGSTWSPAGPVVSNATTDDGLDTGASIHTNGTSEWVVVWSSTYNLGGSIGSDLDIFVALSDDNGASWTGPTVLNDDADSDVLGDSTPVVRTDQAGDWVVVWYRIFDQVYASTSTNDGAAWSSPTALSSGSMGLFPTLGESAGSWVTTWTSTAEFGMNLGTDSDLIFNRSTDAVTWSPPTPLNVSAGPDVGDEFEPKTATDGMGRWLTVWTSSADVYGAGADSDVFFSRSGDDGETWSFPQLLHSYFTTDSGLDAEPEIAADGAGNWVIVWRTNEDVGGTNVDTDLFFSRSTDHGDSWSVPTHLNSNALTDFESDGQPSIHTDGTTWVVVWRSVEGLGGAVLDSAEILFTRSTDAGLNWSPAALVDPSFDNLDNGNPALAADDTGNWVVVWDVVPIGGGDSAIRVSASDDSGQSWGARTYLDPAQVSNSMGDEFPRVATDEMGRWMTVWRGGSDVALAQSTDNGASWSALATPHPPTTFIVAGSEPQIDTDGLGNWLLGWSTQDVTLGAGTDHEVVLFRSRDDGATWTPPTVMNSNAFLDGLSADTDLHLVYGASGTWLGVWISRADFQGAGSDADVFSGRVLVAP